MQNSEQQLLASWILGYNREHIQEFDRFEFYPKIFNAVRSLKEINIISVVKKS